MRTDRGRTVLLTGCSTGIGRAAAELFLAKGWNVAATMRSPDSTRAWPVSDRLAVLRLDVTDSASIDEAVGSAMERFGRIDVLVNNAGYGMTGPLEGWTEALLRKQFETNVLGLVRVTQAVLPHMRARRDGAIVNISSVGGRMTFPMFGAYHGTKWAVEGISEAVRYELAAFNIRVKVVEPGGTRTDFIGRGIVTAEHPAYAESVRHVEAFGRRIDSIQPGVGRVASVIYKAATSRSRRLRYGANALPVFAMHKLLPDWAWWRLVSQIMLPKGARG